MANKKVLTKKIKKPQSPHEVASDKLQKAYSLEDIRLLAKTLTQYDLSELEVEYGGERVRLCREIMRGAASGMPMFAPAAYMPPTYAQPAPAISASAHSAPAAPAKNKSLDERPADDGTQVINSPFVGTFYRAPSPESPPFIEAGQKVRKGQVLCIVEAMKLMNEIEAEIECQIVEILVQNAQPVEFGQALFRVRPQA